MLVKLFSLLLEIFVWAFVGFFRLIKEILTAFIDGILELLVVMSIGLVLLAIVAHFVDFLGGG